MVSWLFFGIEGQSVRAPCAVFPLNLSAWLYSVWLGAAGICISTPTGLPAWRCVLNQLCTQSSLFYQRINGNVTEFKGPICNTPGLIPNSNSHFGIVGQTSQHPESSFWRVMKPRLSLGCPSTRPFHSTPFSCYGHQFQKAFFSLGTRLFHIPYGEEASQSNEAIANSLYCCRCEQNPAP